MRDKRDFRDINNIATSYILSRWYLLFISSLMSFMSLVSLTKNENRILKFA
jgi:hypothetical protein